MSKMMETGQADLVKRMRRVDVEADSFNSVLAARKLPRPGISGATWLSKPSGAEHPIILKRIVGISGSTLRSYSESRPPTAMTRAHTLRAGPVTAEQDTTSASNERIVIKNDIDGEISTAEASVQQLDDPKPERPELQADSSDLELSMHFFTNYSEATLKIDYYTKIIGKALIAEYERITAILGNMENKDTGTITCNQLLSALQKIGIQIQRKDLEMLLYQAGINRDKLNFKSFLRIFITEHNVLQMPDMALREQAAAVFKRHMILRYDPDFTGRVDSTEVVRAFRRFDTNTDGTITIDEMKNSLEACGLGSAEVDILPYLFGHGKHGLFEDRINYKEFLQLIGMLQNVPDRNKHLAYNINGAALGFREIPQIEKKLIRSLSPEGLNRNNQESDCQELVPPTPVGLAVWRNKYQTAYYDKRYLTRHSTGDQSLYQSPRHQYSPSRLSTINCFNGLLEDIPRKGVGGRTSDGSLEEPFESTIVGSPSSHAAAFYEHESSAFPGTSQSMESSTMSSMESFKSRFEFPERWVKPKVLVSEKSQAVLRPPPFVTSLRYKSLKDLENGDLGAGFSNTKKVTSGRSLNGPIDIFNPFGRFQGYWGRHDTVKDFLLENNPPQMSPAHPKNEVRPSVVAFCSDETSENEASHSQDGMRPAGLPSSAFQEHEFSWPIVQKDRLARILMTRSPNVQDRIRGI